MPTTLDTPKKPSWRQSLPSRWVLMGVAAFFIIGFSALGGALLGNFVFPGVGMPAGAYIGSRFGLFLTPAALGWSYILFPTAHTPDRKAALAFLVGIVFAALLGAIFGNVLFPVVGPIIGAGIGMAAYTILSGLTLATRYLIASCSSKVHKGTRIEYEPTREEELTNLNPLSQLGGSTTPPITLTNWQNESSTTHSVRHRTPLDQYQPVNEPPPSGPSF